MSETLGQKQRRFVRLVNLLITWAHNNGYEMSFGETRRSDEQEEINAMGRMGRAGLAALLAKHDYRSLAEKISNNTGSGIRNSLHGLGLAIDLNLFKDGKYLSDTESHRPLGEYWESLGDDCCWGGRFSDGNHYSIAHEGKK